MMNKRELELYIHIPFCARKCAYCDFLSFAVPESTYRDYMDKLIEEIYGQSLCFPDSCVISIFLGGGTPSLLPADLIGELFAVLYGCFTAASASFSGFCCLPWDGFAGLGYGGLRPCCPLRQRPGRAGRLSLLFYTGLKEIARSAKRFCVKIHLVKFVKIL